MNAQRIFTYVYTQLPFRVPVADILPDSQIDVSLHIERQTTAILELPALRQNPLFEELVDQAGGLFIYAATDIRFILPDILSENHHLHLHGGTFRRGIHLLQI